MADTVQKENIMGTQKMSQLVLFTGIPLMISLFINSLYNFVDSMFVSQVSEKALTALSLAAPVQLLVSALGLGNAVGLNAVISKALGRKDTGEVRRAADAAIFIFGLFGMPRLETLGAAIATVIGQTVGMFAGIVINRKWNREIPFGFTLRSDRRSIVNILKVGFPSTLVQILTSFVGILMNSILITFSSTAVAVYGICIRINGISTVGVHGITNGLIPIVAYNYGAEDRKRVSHAIQWSLLYGALFYLLFFAVLEIVPAWVLRIFEASDFMLEIGIPALRILAFAWLVAIPALVISAGLQGLSMGMGSMILTMARQAVLPLLFAGIFSRIENLDLLWTGFILAEFLGIPLAAWLWKKGSGRIQGGKLG